MKTPAITKENTEAKKVVEEAFTKINTEKTEQTDIQKKMTKQQEPFVFEKKEAKIFKRQIKNSGIKYNEESFIKAAENNNTNMVEAFLRAGMKPDAAGESATTPLIWASFNGNISMVKMLTEAGANVNAINRDGFTPLHAAVESGNLEIVKYLLKQGANLNTATHKDLTTPLHTACYKGYKEIAQLLVVAGANVNAKNSHGATPVVTASFYGKEDLVQYLKANGAKIDKKEEKILTVAAISSGKSGSFISLVDSGADVNSIDKDGKTMLQVAVEKSDLNTAEELIKKGANINVKCKYGVNTDVTPLITAVLKQDLLSVKLLLKNGANINVKESLTGATPLHIAVLEGNEDIVAALMYNGADLNVINSSGITPADIALAKKDEVMLRRLVSNGALFGKKTGGILVPFGCSVVFKPENELYYINCSEALKALKKLEESENSVAYNDYMQKTASFRAGRTFTLDKHAYKIYPLLFESI